MCSLQEVYYTLQISYFQKICLFCLKTNSLFYECLILYFSSIELKRIDKYTTYGIEGNKYGGSQKIFDNGTIYPEMKCFIPEGVQLPSGVRNVSSCKYDFFLLNLHHKICRH